MPPDRISSPARLLAPAALVAFALAVALIVLGSGSDDGSKAQKTTEERPTTTQRAGRRRPRPKIYTVKPGDTLGAIGQKTGFDVDILQALNPTLDPQTLTAGQKIKLPPK